MPEITLDFYRVEEEGPKESGDSYQFIYMVSE